MSGKLIRIYENIDFADLKSHLMIYGDISASCANCNGIDIKLDQNECPSCKTSFNYICFRNIKMHMPKMNKITNEHKELKIVDYDDYKRNLSEHKANEFFK